MTPTARPLVYGLPAGVELVRIGLAEENDYEIVGNAIYKGPRQLAASGVIVKPADGYTFEKSKFDMNSYSDTYIVTKIIDPTTVKQTVTFTVANQADLDAVHSALEALKKLNGFVSAE
jgi:hypothetical protein